MPAISISPTVRTDHLARGPARRRTGKGSSGGARGDRATAARAADRARALAVITSAIDVLDYTESTAAHHARLIAHVGKPGNPRGAHDLFIAAHAVETDRVVLSRDAAARFGDLPGVVAVQA